MEGRLSKSLDQMRIKKTWVLSQLRRSRGKQESGWELWEQSLVSSPTPDPTHPSK